MLSSLIPTPAAVAAGAVVVAAMEPAKPPGLPIDVPTPVRLKTLTADGSLESPFKPNCVKRNFAAFTSLAPPLSSEEEKTEAADDRNEEDEVDGLEEEDYVDDEGDEARACWATYGKGKPSCMLPPPIPLLARTGNLTGHMPWVLKRIYKEDGRLVLREERVKHHEYFRAHRENGRLTLQLVQVDHRSPLLVSGPKRSEEEEDDDEECQYHSDQEDIDDDGALMPSQDTQLLDHGGIQSWGSIPSTGMSVMRKSKSAAALSTSMPEPLCGHKRLDRGRPIGQLQIRAMPMVRGY